MSDWKSDYMKSFAGKIGGVIANEKEKTTIKLKRSQKGTGRTDAANKPEDSNER